MDGYQMIYEIVETRGRNQVAKAKINLNLDFQMAGITGRLRKFRVYMSNPRRPYYSYDKGK
jgi:hypothetical protein